MMNPITRNASLYGSVPPLVDTFVALGHQYSSLCEHLEISKGKLSIEVGYHMKDVSDNISNNYFLKYLLKLHCYCKKILSVSSLDAKHKKTEVLNRKVRMHSHDSHSIVTSCLHMSASVHRTCRCPICGHRYLFFLLFPR